MLNINFNNQNSYYDLGLVIERRPNIPAPERKIKLIEVPGGDTLTEDEEIYNDISINIVFGLKENNLFEKSKIINRWLCGSIMDKKLIISDNPNYFYIVKKVTVGDFERQLKYLSKFSVTLICRPYSYMESNKIQITKPCMLHNPGTYFSKPILKIYGSGDITLSINNKSIILKNVADYVTLNSEMQDAYKDTLPKNNDMIGEFPLLEVGENNISWVGNVTKIEITPNWRCL